jgi:large subunit ribosomal protein L15
MATRKRKSRKMRGSRTHGWGVSGQHRKSGMRGGTGRSGTFKHKWTSILRYGDTREGIGFRGPNSLSRSRAINVGELELLTGPGGVQERKTPATLDLTIMGYDKLLGRGSVGRAYNIKVARSSKSAARKIQEAGGTVTARD